MSDSPPGAGLVSAPPYDPSSELDPSLVEPVTPGSDDLQSLSYFKEQHAQQTFRARAVLLTIIFVMLAGNMWLTWQTRSSVMANLDQTRLDQAALSELMETRVTSLETQISDLTAMVGAHQARQEALAAAAEVAE